MVRTVTVMAIWWRCVVNSLLKEAEFRRKVVLLVKEVAKEVGSSGIYCKLQHLHSVYCLPN